MGRLSKILEAARNAEANLEVSIGHKVRKYVERVAAVDEHADRVFLDRHVALDGQMTDLHDFHADLDDFAKNDRSGSGSNDSTPYTGTVPPKS